MSKQAKTSGIDWLGHSLVSFHGSGYGNEDSPEAFVNSYIAYKKWKRLPEQAKLAEVNYSVACGIVERFIGGIYTGHIPSDKRLAEFKSFCEK